MFIIFFCFPLFYYYYYSPVTCHPPPVTRHPPPATRGKVLPLSDRKVPIYTQTSVKNPRRDSGRWGPLNALLRLETFKEFLKLADCAENWRVKHFWIDRRKQKHREEFSNLFLTCCKANQLIEDELRSCFYLKIKENSRSINYNFVDRSVERQIAIRCSKVTICIFWDLVRSPHVGRTSGIGKLARSTSVNIFCLVSWIVKEQDPRNGDSLVCRQLVFKPGLYNPGNFHRYEEK